MKSYSVRTFDNVKGLPGFSEQAVQMHLTLYKGYVDNTNALADRLREALKSGTTMSTEWKELKRRFAWEFNGMRLHEFYFENLTSQPAELAATSPVRKKIEEDFGGYDVWERGFRETGAMRGIGWVMLTVDPQTGRLFNTWLDEHDAGILAGTSPLLIMDVFEHAVLPDFGLKRPDYINAFFRVIDWKTVEARLEAANTR
ncbi:MAG: Fe-Mn family superoxide dismutase [Nitrospira sp.]|nr:Fe-Mn family superoxide dismutase [Nitrospira sp.]